MSKLKRPKSVSLWGGFHLPIYYLSPAEMEHNAGMYRMENGKRWIEICQTLRDQMLHKVIRHELTHAANCISGYEVLLGNEIEEGQTRMQQEAMADIFTLNPTSTAIEWEK